MWTKLTDDTGIELATLSDSAFRTHVEGLLWVMIRERGPYFAKRELPRFADTKGDREAAVAELVAVGYWRDHGDSYEVVKLYSDQIEADVMAERKKKNAKRQAEKRRRDAGLPPLDEDADDGSVTRDVTRDVGRDVTRDVARDPGRVGSGRDGTGNTPKRRNKPKATTASSDSDSDWPDVQFPAAEPSQNGHVVRPVGKCGECGRRITTEQELAAGLCFTHVAWPGRAAAG